MANIYLSWQDLEELISKVVMQLNTPYDSLLLITRGGIIPGGMIAEALKMKDILTASVIFGQDSSVRAEMSWPRFQQFPTDVLLAGKKILVVDNMWDRGRTIVTVASRIKSAGGYPETAVLHWKKNRSLFKDDEPDYYAAITDDWVFYPWQRIDDSGDMIPTGPRVPQLSW